MTAVADTKTRGAGFENEEEIVRVVYDFAKDAGATGSLDLFTAANNLIVTYAHAHVLTACTSGGSATVSAGNADSAAGFIAATAVASLTKDAVIKFVGSLRVAKGAAVSMAIATAALTAGKIEFTFKIQRAVQ